MPEVTDYSQEEIDLLGDLARYLFELGVCPPEVTPCPKPGRPGVQREVGRWGVLRLRVQDTCQETIYTTYALRGARIAWLYTQDNVPLHQALVWSEGVYYLVGINDLPTWLREQGGQLYTHEVRSLWPI
jgi:hypothetical protein